MDPEEAAGTARSLWQGLQEWSRGQAAGRVLVTGVLGAEGYDPRVRVGGLALLACPPARGGVISRPPLCGDAAAPRAAPDHVRGFLSPPAGFDQELSFNPRHFN